MTDNPGFREHGETPPCARILLIDNDLQWRNDLQLLLMRRNYEVHVTDSGREGLLMVRRVRPDLIILDLALPNINGVEVFRLLRCDKTWDDVPVLLTTALEDKDGVYLSMATALGADDFLHKPFADQDLVTRVRGLLSRRTWPRKKKVGPSP